MYNNNSSLKRIYTLFWREFRSHFNTPMAYIFILIFVLFSNYLTFEVGGFFQRGQADLYSFFNYHSLLYVLLVPALSMRLWAEERNSGTMELLLTLPLTIREAVLGKFFAAWLLSGLALLLTFPIWITVNYLGSPDNGVIILSYIGSWLMAGAFLALGSVLSASTHNQVVAFILTLALCLFLVLLGTPSILKLFYHWLPVTIVDLIASVSISQHFQAISRGVLEFRDLVYFIIIIAVGLLSTEAVIYIKSRALK